jgi:hypothetical protein
MLQLFFFITLFLMLFTAKAYAGITLAGAGGGFLVPDNYFVGISQVNTYDLKNAPPSDYIVLNSNYTSPGFGNVGDVIVVTNLQTGKKFTFDSHCSTRKLPPVNLGDLLDPNAYQLYGKQILNISYINKCPNSKYVDPMFLLFMGDDSIEDFLPTMVDISYNPDAPVMVPKDFKQTDPVWADAHLGDQNDCGNLFDFGCAVTAVTDVFSAYGKKQIEDKLLDPGTLNTWLAGKNGFTGCAIVWSNAATAVHLGAPSILFRNNNLDWTEGKDAIDNALNQGNMPILGIMTKYGTHFLTISAKLPDVDGLPDYKIVDPAMYPFEPAMPGNTGKSLSQTYGGFTNVFESIIYKKISVPQKTLTLRAHSPVQLNITDPNGHQTGFNPASQTIMQNITSSTYGVEPGIASTDGSSSAGDETKYFQVINPTEGYYKIEVVGIGNGSYTLDITTTDDQGNSSTSIIKGFAQTAITEMYDLKYSNNATSAPVLNREVTYTILQADITTMYKLGGISNKQVYEKLRKAASEAEKKNLSKNQPHGTTQAIAALKALQSELDKARGQSISEDAYKIISADSTYLINKL